MLVLQGQSGVDFYICRTVSAGAEGLARSFRDGVGLISPRKSKQEVRSICDEVRSMPSLAGLRIPAAERGQGYSARTPRCTA